MKLVGNDGFGDQATGFSGDSSGKNSTALVTDTWGSGGDSSNTPATYDWGSSGNGFSSNTGYGGNSGGGDRACYGCGQAGHQVCHTADPLHTNILTEINRSVTALKVAPVTAVVAVIVLAMAVAKSAIR